MDPLDNPELWPVPEYTLEKEPHFCFIATPPNSGSTVIAKLLDTSPRTTMLTYNAEAQWIVPGLRRDHRWMASMRVNGASIRASWLAAYAEQLPQNPGADVVIEKSPPNLVRMDQITSLFKSVSVVVNNRDPYANIASVGYRYFDFDKLDLNARLAEFPRIVESWQMRSRYLRDLVTVNGYPLVTYETFCAKPATLLEKLILPAGVAETIDLGASVTVKDYEAQPLENQNERQIAMLDRAEIAKISELLASDPELLDFFGYEIRATPRRDYFKWLRR